MLSPCQVHSVAALMVGVTLCAAVYEASAQGSPATDALPVRIDYVSYRQARWEQQHVRESVLDVPNRGGLVFAYFTNTSDRRVDLRTWHINRMDGPAYRLRGLVAWDRILTESLEPGQTGVAEICGVSEGFGPDTDIEFALETTSWRPAGGTRARLSEDSVQVSYLRVMPGMRSVEVHLRNTGKETARIGVAEVAGIGSAVEWATPALKPHRSTIARLQLDRPLTPGELFIVRIELSEGERTRAIYSHRRAFEDWFPIGTWSNSPETHALLRRHHIETVVTGSSRPDDEFHAHVAPRYGFRSMIHTGVYPDVDTLRSMDTDPVVACWMPHDEPDWVYTPQMMLASVEMTRSHGPRKPILITLCRNVKFFEYAHLADIPCQDHYSVTAPSSSVWPYRYGTRLEETAYYTRDLKMASEPKPVWIWSQALATWSQRPKRPVPTPDELAAQLLFNLGRGAKGILWFNFEQDIGERFPDTMQAVQQWGRVLQLIRDDFIGAEPVMADVEAPDSVDVAVLATWDRLFVIAVNLNYEIHDEAYPWTAAEGVRVSLELPDWLTPAAAIALEPGGVSDIPTSADGRRVELDLGRLEVCQVLALPNDPAAREAYEQRYAAALEQETRDY